jgi:hypothetical protein
MFLFRVHHQPPAVAVRGAFQGLCFLLEENKMKSISISSSRIRQLFALGSLASIVSLLGVAVPTRLVQAQVGSTPACAAYPATLKNDFWSYYIFDDMQWTNSDFNTGRIAVGGTFLYNNTNNPDGNPTGGFGNNGDCTSAPGISRPDVVVGAFRSTANAATDLYAFHNAGLRYIDQTLAPASSFSPQGQDFTSTDIFRATRCASATAPTVAEIDVTTFNTLTNMAAVKTALLGADVAATLPDNDDDPNTPGTTGDPIPGCTGTNLWDPGFGGAAAPDPNPNYGYNFKHPTSGYSYDLAVAGGVGATAVDSSGGTSFGATSPSGALVKAHKAGGVEQYVIDTTAAPAGDVYVNIPVPATGMAPVGWTITIKPTQNLIINFASNGAAATQVIGGSTTNFSLTGGDESNLLWNFPNTPQVYLGDPPSPIPFKGTILAPCGQVLTKGVNLTLTGQIVAAKGSPGGYGKVTGNGFCSASTAPTLLTLDGVRVSNNNISSIAFASISALLLLAGGALLLNKRVTR